MFVLDPPEGDQDMRKAFCLKNTRMPTDELDSANKKYVDDSISAATLNAMILQDPANEIDLHTNPNYPAAVAGAVYRVGTAGLIGGANGRFADVGDLIVAGQDNAGGDQAAVGSSWSVFRQNGGLFTYVKTISFSDFATLGANRTLANVFTVPAGEILVNVSMRHTAAWQRSTCAPGTILTVIMQLREHISLDPLTVGLNVFNPPNQLDGFISQDLVGCNEAQIDVNVAVQASAAPCSSFFPDSGIAILVFQTQRFTAL